MRLKVWMQTLNLHLPAAKAAPLVVFVVGGGWAKDGKRGGEGGQPQAFVANGYAYASVNYRLYPQASPEQQAADIARSVAFLCANASRYGYDGERIALMGHSAGAHLAARVALDPTYLHAVHVDPATIQALVLLDGTSDDIPKQIASGGNAKFHETVHGSDTAKQLWHSPLTHVGKGSTPDTLLNYVARREASHLQANELAAAIRTSGGTAQTFAAEDESHMSINRGFGQANDPTTQRTFEFLRQALR
jgi:arylformamidase